MSEEVKQYQQQHVDEPCVHKATAGNVAEEGGVDAKDRGLFNFTGKKEEEKKAEEEGIVNEFEPKVQVREPERKKKVEEEKVSGEHKTEKISVPVEKCEESEEKKGFVGKIKERIPGGHKKAEEVAAPPPPYQAPECASPDAEAKEKKGFMDKIKEKIPGYHPKTEEEKEKEKV